MVSLGSTNSAATRCSRHIRAVAGLPAVAWQAL